MRLSQRISDVSPSQTLAISNKAKMMKKEGVDVIGFGAGEPDFDTPIHIKDAAKKSLDAGFTKYTAASGIPELKDAVIKKIERDNGFSYEQNQIIISCGAKHSLFNVFFVLCDTGDEVLIPSPYWLSYPEMVKMAGAVPVFVDGSEDAEFKVTVEQLEKAITPRTRALILNSPSNPTGSVYTKEELMKIADFAIEKNIYVISDEIYDKIIYEDNVYASISSYGQKIKDLLVIVNGVSKTYSMTGWRIGYIAAPVEIAKAVSNLQSHSTSNPTSFAQYGAVEALMGDQSCITNKVTEFKKRRDYMMGRFENMKNLSCVTPLGAFYTFPNIAKTGKTSTEIAGELLDSVHVAVVPGVAFGRDENIRLSFATSMENIEKGLDRIEKYLESI
ncbi:MAG: pyridoxal phosphate-dependent aminotransferase [Candidatus Ancaeobacter aquaticus]|nr:pyridoxal phosphate-dependent aminotransferase [Candidatus Ancaeobacter aquaticus]